MAPVQCSVLLPNGASFNARRTALLRRKRLEQDLHRQEGSSDALTTIPRSPDLGHARGLGLRINYFTLKRYFLCLVSAIEEQKMKYQKNEAKRWARENLPGIGGGIIQPLNDGFG
jgi:hypothetical protein